MNIDDLKPSPYNPRTITQHALDGLTFSLKEFGDLSGIVWNKNTGHIVAGHQRLRALKEKYGDQLALRENNAGEATTFSLITSDGHEFPIRTVVWKEPFEKAANLTANATHITGNFTPDVNSVIEDILGELPEIASSLEFDLLKMKLDEVEDITDDEEEKKPKAMTCPECQYKWIIK